MLAQLFIRNIAVIEKASIDFERGFTALTGETGAGKSIIIDALYAVLGERTSRELVRTGAAQASVSALFTDLSPKTRRVLGDLGVPAEEDGSLLIQREIRVNGGRSGCKLNGAPATVSMLREVGATLIDILGQHESYSLLSPDVHGEYIDSFAGTKPLLAAYRESFDALREIRRSLEKIETDEGEKARRLDILRYQIDELETAAPQPGEMDRLTERRDVIRNSARITRSVSEAHLRLNGDENADGAVQSVSAAADAVEAAARFAPQLGEIAQQLRDAEYTLSDASDSLSDFLENASFDPDALEEIEGRLELLRKLSMKYGATEEEMLAFLDNAKNALREIEFSDERRAALAAEYEQKKAQAISLAKKLSAARKASCEKFEKRVMSELSELNMPGVRFAVSLERTPLTNFGCDRIEFLVSANAGEEAKPMSKIASGGELSRIMLAIHTVLSDADGAATKIFDEVDAGISGEAGHKVGVKLRSVSEHAQVICVTHLAQIAAMADHQLYVEKREENDRTFTEVRALSQDERVREIARIIGGDDISPLRLRMAEEMLGKGSGG